MTTLTATIAARYNVAKSAIVNTTDSEAFEEIPLYRYRVVGGDFLNPTTQEYKEGDFTIESTSPYLSDSSDDFRCYSLVGQIGFIRLDDRWQKHVGSGGYTNGDLVVDDLSLDDFKGFSQGEGVLFNYFV